MRVPHAIEHVLDSPLPGITWADAAAASGKPLTPLTRWRDLRPDEEREWETPFADPGFEPRSGTMPPRQIEALASALGAVTAPDPVFFGVWDGFGSLPYRMPPCPRFRFGYLDYLLFDGALADAGHSYAEHSWDFQAASLWWPASRAWVVHTYIEATSTVVACTEQVADAIVAAPAVGALALTSDDVATLYCGYESRS